MILILTQFGDPTTDDLIERLTLRGARLIRFDTADFPQRTRHTMLKSPALSADILEIAGETVDLRQVSTVWNRRPKAPVVSEMMDPQDREFAQAETDLIYRGLLQSLHNRFWINPHFTNLASGYKPYQLQVAQRVGWEIPATIITNDPVQARRFLQQAEGEVIYKAVSAYYRWENQGSDRKSFAIYTNRLKESDLERLDAVAHTPCLFQEYIPKQVELRVTVVGRKTFAAEIHSQQSERSKEDWRRYDFENTPYYPHQLPAEVEAKCQRLVQELGLVFGCIDLILTPDNRYVFLEINPNGQWGWIEELTKLPIGDNLVEMMIQGTPNYTNPPVTVNPAMAVAEA